MRVGGVGSGGPVGGPRRWPFSRRVQPGSATVNPESPIGQVPPAHKPTWRTWRVLTWFRGLFRSKKRPPENQNPPQQGHIDTQA